MIDQTQATPPDPVDDLAKILKAWKLRGGNWPHGLPLAPDDAARTWMGWQEPMSAREKPNAIPIPATRTEPERHRWQTPYNDRVVQALRVFLRHDRPAQRYIMAAIEDGIPYRGEDNTTPCQQLLGRTLYQNIVHETERMREIGVAEYRRENLARLQRVLRGREKD